MSTELFKIKGRYEESHGPGFKVTYGKLDIYGTRFCRGLNRPMLQLTLSLDSPGYIQLTKLQAIRLAKTILKEFT